ncbi:hypothetical protein [Flexivirga lutea]
MLSKTSRKDAAQDVAKDTAANLVSAAVDAAETGRDKLAPVVENVTGQLSEAAEKAKGRATDAAAAAADAAAPRVAEAKKQTRRQLKKHAAQVKKQAEEAQQQAAKRAEGQLKQSRKQTKQSAKQAKRATKHARKAAREVSGAAAPHLAQAREATAQAAGLTSEQARQLFREEWMPRVHEAIAAAATAGGQAYAALPQQAREAVDAVAPQAVKNRRKKGGLLIALGLLAGAGAVALIVNGKQKDAPGSAPATLPEVERLDVTAVETDGTAVLGDSDDAVGDLEQKVDASVSGRRGRHAAQE